MDQTLPSNITLVLYLKFYSHRHMYLLLTVLFMHSNMSSLRTSHHQMTSLSARPWEIPLRLEPGTLQAFPVTLSLSTMVLLSVIHGDGESVAEVYWGKVNSLVTDKFLGDIHVLFKVE